MTAPRMICHLEAMLLHVEATKEQLADVAPDLAFTVVVLHDRLYATERSRVVEFLRQALDRAGERGNERVADALWEAVRLFETGEL